MSALTISLEQAAVTLAELGYHVFPCRPGRKEPLTSNGFKSATRDERQILHWWTQHPQANIGIACGASGIAVLDIDAKHGANPTEILDGSRPTSGAPIVLTGIAPAADDTHPRSLRGTRGAQVYFRGNLPTCDLPLEGCEIRGQGAYIVAPPSLHPSGATYGPAELPPVSKLPSVPEWLADLAATRRNETGPAAPIGEIIRKGEQHKTLVSLAGSMRRRGMNAKEIEAALLVTNEERLEDPAPPENIRRIAQDIARYPAGGTSPNGFVPLAKDAREAAKQLGELLTLPNVQMHITSARVYGRGSGATLEIDVSNGETLTFATLREMMRPQALIAEVAACTGTAPVLKQVDCARALTLARQVATLVEVDSENDIAREWGIDFLDIADVLDLDINNQAERWTAFGHLAARDPWSRFNEPSDGPTMPLVLRHIDGTRYVRTLWFERYVKTRDSSVSRTAIGPRMARIGWARRGSKGDIKATAPGRPEIRIYPFWVVPNDWNLPQEAAA